MIKSKEIYIDRPMQKPTPAYIYHEQILEKKCNFLKFISSKTDVKFIYALKAQNFTPIVMKIAQYSEGLACSSMFEAFMSESLRTSNTELHYTAPGIRPDEIFEICQLCDFVSFNSLSQWNRFKLIALNAASAGLRINPQISFVEDDRYNPSGKYSKLGVPLDSLLKAINDDFAQFKGLEGLHFHTNSESSDFSPLLETVLHLDQTISPLLEQVKWINLGGGYYFSDDMDYAPFEQAVALLKSKYDLDVIIEPGTAIAQEAGSLISSVIDLFESDGKTIAILDTTVNHLPEVLEFEYSPSVEGVKDSGEYEYILAGASCLAGDKFGTYRFDKPLELGSRITFENVGAYSLVKAHMFNGINLPSVYCKDENGRIALLKEYTYEDFLDRCGANVSERLRKRA